jgi:pseudouridine kinase
MQSREIIVIGGANIDIKARPDGVMKSATSNPGKVTISAGGVARNIAHNLALLGCRTALVTRLGDDEQGERLYRETKAAGVDMSLAVRCKDATGIYCAVLDNEGELAIAVNSMEIVDGLLPSQLSIHAPRLQTANFIVADCNLPQETLEWLADFARDTGQRVVVEAVSVPKSMKIKTLLNGGRRLYAVTPNLLQAHALTGIRIERASDAFAAARSLAKMGIELVVLTLGEQGVYVHSPDGSAHIPPFPVPGTVDVTGAGDAMTAGLIFGLIEGMSPLEAAHYGQAAASITIAAADSVSSRLTKEGMLALARSRMGIPLR